MVNFNSMDSCPWRSGRLFEGSFMKCITHYLVIGFLSFSSFNLMAFDLEEWKRSLYQYPDPLELLGSYEGEVKGSLFNKKCHLDITDLDTLSVRFEMSISKNSKRQRLLSIKGYKKNFYTRAQEGELLVKASRYFDDYQEYYGYVIDIREEQNLGETTIKLNNNNLPLSFTYKRHYEKDITCENLKRI
jgi:hypothetical protein